ncbi:hypothetical protein H7F33_06430 [Pedobacter sp. PAMC26386]|nr:hypothetical protein H7F33_06430 [Pedobacter sp. PAMC26386]
MNNILIILILFVTSLANAQIKPFYNWKGNNLPLYAKPDTNSTILINIPKSGAVQPIHHQVKLPAFNIILSYFGSTSKPEGGDVYDTGGTFYTMPGIWVKVIYKGQAGFVPDLFLSSLPDLAVHNAKNFEFEDIAAGYMAGLFGAPVAQQKQELPKQNKEEINYTKTYRYKNGNYLLGTFSYFEEGGVGGETYTLFFKGLKKHEAILVLLKLTSFDSISNDQLKKLKKRIITHSPYDQFSWWYNSNAPKEGIPELEFFYYQEGGTTNASINETKDGVTITYSFGGC